MLSVYNCYSCHCVWSGKRRLGHVKKPSVYCSTHIGGKRGKGAVARAGMGSQIGQLPLGKEPAEMGIRSLVQGATIPSRGLFLATYSK
jgi:hypothetical protein